MAVNDLKEVFGTQVDLDSTSAAVNDDAFSIATDLENFTNTGDAPQANVVLLANFSVAPAIDSLINLYLKPLDIEGTNDPETPDADFPHIYVGSFPLNNVTTAQYTTIQISLPNTKTGQVYEVYIENKSGSTLPAGWIIYVTPTTVGPETA